MSDLSKTTPATTETKPVCYSCGKEKVAGRDFTAKYPNDPTRKCYTCTVAGR